MKIDRLCGKFDRILRFLRFCHNYVTIVAGFVGFVVLLGLVVILSRFCHYV